VSKAEAEASNDVINALEVAEKMVEIRDKRWQMKLQEVQESSRHDSEHVGRSIILLLLQLLFLLPHE